MRGDFAIHLRDDEFVQDAAEIYIRSTSPTTSWISRTRFSAENPFYVSLSTLMTHSTRRETRTQTQRDWCLSFNGSENLLISARQRIVEFIFSPAMIYCFTGPTVIYLLRHNPSSETTVKNDAAELLKAYSWTLFLLTGCTYAIVTLRQSCPKFRVKMIFLLSQLVEPKRNAFPGDASLSRTS